MLKPKREKITQKHTKRNNRKKNKEKKKKPWVASQAALL